MEANSIALAAMVLWTSVGPSPLPVAGPGPTGVAGPSAEATTTDDDAPTGTVLCLVQNVTPDGLYGTLVCLTFTDP